MKFTQTRCNTYRPPVGKADHVIFDADMPGFGMRYRNGGPGTYFVQYRLGKKDGRLAIGKVSKITLDDARTEARKQFALVANRVDPAVERAQAVAATADTIEPLIPDFLEYLSRNSRSATYVAAATRSLNSRFKALHKFSAGNITRTMVAKELSKIRTEHGPISADVSRAHLSKFFSWCVGEGLAHANPVTGTNKTGSTVRTRVLIDAELGAVWRALGADDYGDICRLLILTGARRDEIGSLARSEIDFDRKQIELPGHRTKNGLAHIIPLAPTALKILSDRKAREESDFVFGRGAGGFSGWSNCKEKLDEKLDLDHWTLHDFRRTLSTVMHETLKVPPHVVEAILNHISGAKAGVAGIYNRAEYLAEKREALEKYANYVDGLVNPRPRLTVVR